MMKSYRITRLQIFAILITAWCMAGGTRAMGQASARQIKLILAPVLESPEVAQFQVQEYLMSRVAPLPQPRSASQWTGQAAAIRKRLLDQVVFHGWPAAWVNAAPHFEDLGDAGGGRGYRIRKLRYEIVPGFWSAALLYAPDPLRAPAPAILNLNGHVGAGGKAVEYKQKRCINYALRGMIALNLEYLNMGELMTPENDHRFAVHLDLVGANGVGLFYLAMRRGLDYLAASPNVDAKRIGVTGLSGGGWQTITLSALDERVAAAVPVAGYSALPTSIEHPRYSGDDPEQDAPDFRAGQDYATLTAMLAPRPALLINNAEDSCCFRAPIVKPYIYDAIVPFYSLYGAARNFWWHQNTDPSTHNYQVDNREQSYRFFDHYFGLPAKDQEIPVDAQIKSPEELQVGLPAGNLTILGLARALAGQLQRPPLPQGKAAMAQWTAAERKQLGEVVRYRAVSLKHAWTITNTHHQSIESIGYRFEMTNNLSATGVWLKAIHSPATAPATLVMDDKGMKEAGLLVANRLDRGEQVLAADPLLIGDAAPNPPEGGPAVDALMLSSIGKRPLGMEAAQLAVLAQWMAAKSNQHGVRIETRGMRSQLIALVAAALHPGLITSIESFDAIPSLKTLLDRPAKFDDAPEMFCLDLYKYFDVDRLELLCAPATITRREKMELPLQ